MSSVIRGIDNFDSSDVSSPAISAEAFLMLGQASQVLYYSNNSEANAQTKNLDSFSDSTYGLAGKDYAGNGVETIALLSAGDAFTITLWQFQSSASTGSLTLNMSVNGVTQSSVTTQTATNTGDQSITLSPPAYFVITQAMVDGRSGGNDTLKFWHGGSSLGSNSFQYIYYKIYRDSRL